MAEYMQPTYSIECVNYRGGSTKLDIKDIWYTVARVLNVDHREIDGVQQRNVKRWDITLFPECQETLDRIKYDFMDSEIRICNDKLIRILDPLETVTEVTGALTSHC